MKKLKVHTRQFQKILESFREWLQMLNYSPITIELYCNQSREFLYYLETELEINSLKVLTYQDLIQFQQYIESRTHTVKGGGLSSSHINSIIQTVNKLMEYLSQVDIVKVEPIGRNVKEERKEKEIVSVDEIKVLLESIDLNHPIGYRTRAIIGLLYGAGLRKSELEYLSVEDIDYTNGLLHVRNGKGRKERLIPLSNQIIEFILTYQRECRDILFDIADQKSDYLLIEITGNKMSETAIYNAVKDAIENSGIESLKSKKITLHSFRHSIATHLMDKGMDIEDIAKFLGHNSLDSTMIYTHINDGRI